MGTAVGSASLKFLIDNPLSPMLAEEETAIRKR
jgi:hypothetical protein